MLLGVKTFADDPARGHHREVRRLGPQILDGLFALLPDLGTGPRDQRLGLLARLCFQFLAQVLTLLRDPVEDGLRLTPRLLELHLTFSFRLLQLPLRSFGRFDALLAALPALVQAPQQRPT